MADPHRAIRHPRDRARMLNAALAGTLAAAATSALARDDAPPAALAAASTIVQEQGTARDPRSGRVLYLEQHWMRRDAAGRPLARVVLYRCPGAAMASAAFARKRLDYRSAATAPRFAFEDARNGYREGLRAGQSPRLFVRAGAGVAERTAPLAGAGVVVDAGFDEFVRAHWDALLAGRMLPIEFALPSRLRSYRFKVARVTGARTAADTTSAREPLLHLRLQLEGWLAWIAPAIDVHYGLRSRRLVRFEGPGTIRDAAGDKPLPARIEFERGPAPASEADWTEALAVPLSGCVAGRAADTPKANTDTHGAVATR